MTTLTIYRSASPILTIDIDEKTVFSKKIMGEHKIICNYISGVPLGLSIGDYITYNSENFYLNRVPDVDKVSNTMYKYSMMFEGVIMNLAKKIFISSDGLAEFAYTGEATDFLTNIISNINEIDATWSKGDVDSTDERTLTFSNESCRTALTKVAQEFKLEFNIAAKVITMEETIGANTGYSFEYGQDNGLYKINRTQVSNQNIITKVWGFGGTKNIPSTYRSRAKRLVFEDRYLTKNTGLYGVIEGQFTDDEIYPQRTGTISAINMVFDSGVYNPRSSYIEDSGITFDLNDYLIAGVVPQIVFKTGDLSGRAHDIWRYDHANTRIYFNPYLDADGFGTPKETTNEPAVSDTYTLIGIAMPQSYIDTAETDLETDTQAFLDQNCVPKVVYALDIDPIYARSESLDINVGDNVTVTDVSLGISGYIRISAISYPLVNEYDVKCVISDFVPYTTQERIIKTAVETQQVGVAGVIVLTESLRQEAVRAAQIRDFVFDPDGYFDPINFKPLSIETMYLSVGGRSQQFTVGATVDANPGADVTKMNASAGSLTHFTISTSILTWTLYANNQTGLTSGTAYYLYARCDKTNYTSANNQIIADTVQRTLDGDATYYYFLIGVLHAAVDSVRYVALTYGMTVINGKFITTGRITGGSTYFDLDTGDIVGKITFSSDSSGYDNLTDKPASLNDINTDEYDLLESTAKITYSATEPSSPSTGDLWVETDNDYTTFVWSSAAWIAISSEDAIQAIADASTAQSTADGKALVTYAATSPGSPETGDMWVDTDDDYKTFIWSGAAWVSISNTDALQALADAVTAQAAADSAQSDATQALSDAATAQTTADGRALVTYDATAPVAPTEGDIWIDTDDDYKTAVWSGSAWVAISNEDALQAISDASSAQSTADGKALVTYDTTEPGSPEIGDLWVDTDDDYKTYIYTGATWQALSSVDAIQALADASTAQDDATQALSDASDAQNTADGKALVTYNATAPSTPTEGDIWIDTDDDYKTFVWSSSAWVSISNTDALSAIADAADAQSTADGKALVTYADTAPSSPEIGDLWVDTNDSYKTTIWSGAAWIDISSSDALQGISDASDAQEDATQALSDAATAQTTADGKAIVTYATTAPGSPEEGDIWIDTDDDYATAVWSGAAWVPISNADAIQALADASTAQDTADGKAIVTYATTAPGSPDTGDLWVDTDDDYKMYIYTGADWQTVSSDDAIQALADAASAQSDATQALSDASTAQTTADGKAVVTYNASAPGSPEEGDIWIDTDDDYKSYVYNGSGWTEITTVDGIQALSDASTAQSTADGKALVTYDTSAPGSPEIGDIWVDTDDDYKTYVYTGAAWQAISSADALQAISDAADAQSDATQALSDASDAQSTADGKILMFYQDAEPGAGMSDGDIWIDTNDDNKIYIYETDTWVLRQDSGIAAAIQDASDAQATADGKVTTFFQSAAPTAEGIGDLWYDTDVGILYRWDGSDWNDNVADVTQTIIDGGLITTGRLEVQNDSAAQGGITGTISSGSTAVGLWLGSTYANRATAPFRVTHAGVVTAASGTIGGWTLATDAIYTGTKHTGDGYSTTGITLAADGSLHAPSFHIDADGALGITGASIKTADTGERVEILNTTGYIEFYDGADNLDLRIGLNPIGKLPYILFSGVQDSYLSNTEINFGSHKVLGWGGTDYETILYYDGDAVAYCDAVGLRTNNIVLHSNPAGVFPYPDHSTSGDIYEFTAGTALVFGDICYMGSDGKMEKADANGSGTYPAWAFCLETIAENSDGRFMTKGVICDASFIAMTVGSVIYLSATAGAISNTAPATSGYHVQVLGRCTHADRIWFNPSNDYYTVD